MSFLASSQLGFTPFRMHTWSSVEAFRIQGSGLGFRDLCSGIRVQGLGYRVQGSVFWVQGSVFWVQGSGFRVWGSCELFKYVNLWCREAYPLEEASRMTWFRICG